NIPKFLNSSFAWLAKLFTEVPTMTDETTAAPAPAATPSPAPAAAPVAAAPVEPAVNTDTLKALLLTLGHNIEAEWDHLIALAKKI
ncbi:hypothetical protein, partial [Pseudomonas gingeri]|uniref:hypothetical protein n=1 Tax=Pseudomonas gingeri TaxID=117681 RepID=UPI001C42E5B5